MRSEDLTPAKTVGARARRDRNRLLPAGLRLTVAGTAFVVGAGLLGRDCDFETMEVCRAFGIWSGQALYIELAAMGVALAGAATLVVGATLCFIGGVLFVGRRLIAGGLD
jgi:hypothetical protein